MDIDCTDITRYLDFLVSDLKYQITLHGAPAEWPEFVKYNFHLNPYCHYVKTVCACWPECIRRQSRVRQACASGAFFGVCYAGVGEYVYPLAPDGTCIGFLSVSGYLGRDESVATGKVRHFANAHHVPYDQLVAMRTRYLRPPVPDDAVDTVVRPLVIMLSMYAAQRRTVAPHNDDLYTRLLRTIHVHHHTALTMPQLARTLHCSVSTLSHMFRQRTGMSIRAYIEKLRIDEAKWLLVQSDFSVTEVSDCLGFCNAAYFSSVFKKACGLSPKAYARQTRTS